MKLSSHCLKRYKDIVLLCIKYAQPGMFSHFRTDGDELPLSSAAQREAKQLPDDLERMGPTFVKLGQLLSSRPDLVPEYHRMLLSRLQDRVKPFPYPEVEFIIEAELGARVSDVFSTFEREPLAAASLGQVHRATLRDSRSVVVKVQRPNIRQQLEEDFIALAEVAKFLHRHTQFGQRYQLPKILEEFETTLSQEVDYRQEAANMLTLAHNLREFPQVRVPLPIESCSTSKVLTMERIEGIKITELQPIERVDLDGSPLAEEVFRAYLKQVLVDGVFHADPHPGNVFLTPNRQLALLDLGMVGHLTPSMRESLLKLLLAISEGDGDEAAAIAISISDTQDDFDETEFRHKIGQAVALQLNSTLEKMDIGKTILKVSRCAADTGLHVPTELALLGKTLLQLDEIGRILAPDFDPNNCVRRHASEILNQRMKALFTEGKFFSSLLEVRQFLGALPTRAGRILDSIGKAELKLKVHPAETQLFIESFQKIANRITAGLIFAALIVGAALLMRVDTRFRVFGYPGLAMVCFMGAVAGGLYLVVNTLWQDHKSKRKIRR